MEEPLSRETLALQAGDNRNSEIQQYRSALAHSRPLYIDHSKILNDKYFTWRKITYRGYSDCANNYW